MYIQIIHGTFYQNSTLVTESSSFIFSAIERAVNKYQTRDRDQLLGHLWADYGQRRARALQDTPEYNTLLSMDDCEVFRSDCSLIGNFHVTSLAIPYIQS